MFKLQELLEDPEARTEAIEIIRSLIDRISLTPSEGGFEIELVGKIANRIERANGAKNKNKTATSGEATAQAYRRSVKVVAGAGFVQAPTTTELKIAV